MKKIMAWLVLCCFIVTGCGSGAKAEQEILWKNAAYNAAETYDVIVVGTEPEGIAAAVSAARNGMKTLLLGEDTALGGLMTQWAAVPLISQKRAISFCRWQRRNHF